ncbi:MAG: CCA tRNA nucleotidyltransferase [Candidatus Desulfofervidaceae bacterium]|nr:CCA tRNA nucleotidyltransferase [Candidatus Desulfofervidaceae bacterium]
MQEELIYKGLFSPFLKSHWDNLQKIASKRNIKEVYLVGGALRDLFLQRPVQDWDIALKKEVKMIAHLFAQAIKAHFVVLDEKWETYRVIKEKQIFDFTPLRGKDIFEDLKERDYTINAMAINLINPQGIIDPTQGKQDLQKRLLRVISPRAFWQDPLRILRGVRLGAELNFSLERETRQLMKRYAPLLKNIPGERAYQEFKRLFLTNRAAAWTKEMGNLDIFKALLPEIEAMKGVTQDGFHHLDVYAHSLLTLEKMEEIIIQPEKFFPEPATSHQSPVTNYLCLPFHIFCLKWSALCHDIGKPSCRAQGEKRITFYRHNKVGANLFERIAQRLRFASKEKELITFFITQHMWPFHLLALFLKQELSLRAVHRFIRKAEPHTIGLFILAMADNQAAQGPGKPPEYDKAFLAFYQYVLRIRAQYLKLKQQPPLVTGHDIIHWFQLKPGPIIGKLLREIEEERFRGNIKTKEDARIWLEKRLDMH